MEQDTIDKLSDKFQKIGIFKSMNHHLKNLIEQKIIYKFRIEKTEYGNDLTIWLTEDEMLIFRTDLDGRCRMSNGIGSPLDLIDVNYFNELNNGLPDTGHGYGR